MKNKKISDDMFENLLDSKNETATFLCYIGLVPFVGLSLLLWLPFDLPFNIKASVLDAFLLYSAIMITFLGGIHWGLALSLRYAPPLQLVFSMIPALFAWMGFLLPAFMGVLILIGCYGTQLFFDRELYQQSWFVKLRTKTSIVVAVCLLAVLVHVIFR